MTDRITIPRALLEQALEALTCNLHPTWIGLPQTVEANRAELAKPEQEESFIPDWANYRQGVADGKAGSPKWHDAPTESGLWVQRSVIWSALEYVRQEDMAAQNWRGRWYGPIPQDKEGGAA